MKLRSFLTIAAVVGIVYAVGLLLVPEFMATTYGMGTSPSEILLARLFGGTLLVVGLIQWLSRDFTGATVRPVIVSSLVGEIVGLIVALLGTLGGTMNSFGWSAVVIYLVIGLGFAYYQFMGAPK
jgi:uncharacterized membrane protein